MSSSSGDFVQRATLRSTRIWNVLILLWLVPIVALTLAAGTISWRCVDNLIVSSNRSSALLAKGMLQRDFDHLIHYVEAMAAEPHFVAALKSGDTAAVHEFVRTMALDSDQIEEVLVCGLDEKVLAASGPPPSYDGSTIGRRIQTLKAVLDTQTSQVSGVYFLPRASRQMVVSVACPVRDLPDRGRPRPTPVGGPKSSEASPHGTGHDLLGVMLCQIPLAELASYVECIGGSGNGQIVVIDHHGRLAVHPRLDFRQGPCLDFADLAPVRAAQDGQESQVDYDDPLAKKRMTAVFLPVKIVGRSWVVAAQQPRDAAYAPIRRPALQLGLAVLIAVGMCLLAVVCIQRMGRSLSREQDSLKRLLDLYERQRQVLAFEIHDGLVQDLAGARMMFESLARTAENEEVRRRLADGTELLQKSFLEARRLMSGMRPAILDDFGVVPAVSALVQETKMQSGLAIDWSHDVRFERIAPPLETTVFRVIQEGLTNAVRHSGSDRLRIALRQSGDRLRIEIEDWGKGFDPQKVNPGHFGLLGIRERARLLGGHATIESQPQRGTRIVVDLPVVLAAGDL